MLKFALQSFLGLGVVILTFIAGAFLTSLSPATSGKYMSPLGQIMVAVLIFVATLALGLLARFKSGVLFATLALTVLFEIALLSALAGGNWANDMSDIWNHTLLPVLCSAIVLSVIRIIQKPHD